MQINNRVFGTVLSFTDYFKENNKSIADIAKFALSDDEIDYASTNSAIKSYIAIEPSSSSTLVNKLYTAILSDKVFKVNTDDVVIKADTVYIPKNTVEFQFYSDGQYIEFINYNYISSIVVDGQKLYNLNKSYIYIKNNVVLELKKDFVDVTLNVFSEKSDKVKIITIKPM